MSGRESRPARLPELEELLELEELEDEELEDEELEDEELEDEELDELEVLLEEELLEEESSSESLPPQAPRLRLTTTSRIVQNLLNFAFILVSRVLIDLTRSICCFGSG